MSELSIREGRLSDLESLFALGEQAHRASRRARGLVSGDAAADEQVRADWCRERPVVEFLAAQPDGCFYVAEDGDGLAGYVIISRFGSMDELVELWVLPAHAGRGVARRLLEHAWPDPPTRELGRAAVAVGTPADLTLLTDFGVMPVDGHWHLRHSAARYLEQRARERDAAEPDVHVLTPERAVAEWTRLEPDAIGHERPLLHEFFGRTRKCLATVSTDSGRSRGLCWVSSEGEIGPAVGEQPEELVPVVLAALDRVAKQQEPETLGVFCTSSSWWLLDRLRRLGFRVHWPAWVLSSVPLPGLDRYLPTRPPRLL